MNPLWAVNAPRRRLGSRVPGWPAAFLWAGTLAAASLGATERLPTADALKTMTLEQLLDVDVTSVSRRPERLFTAPAAIQMITGEDVRRSGATSLAEALRLASNLEVAQIDARQWAITARGFNNLFASKMLVMVDGRSVYTPLYAGVYWDVQDLLLDDLDRIEVISGPGATLWGSNAVNGVVNITSKNAKDTQGTLVQAGAGSELRSSGAVRYGGRTAGGVYYRVYAKYFERDQSVRPSGRGSDDSWHMTQAGFRADWNRGPDDAFTAQSDIYLGYLGQPGPDNIRVTGENVLGRWSRTLAAGSDVRLQTYVDHTHRRIPGSFTQDLTTFDLDFQHHREARGHDLVWGLGYRVTADDIINTPANAFVPAKVTHMLFNAFVQDEFSLVPDRVSLTGGTKIEHNDYTGFEVEPSLRLSFTPTRQQTVWAAVSRAVKIPSRIDRDLYSPATPPYRIAGGPDVISEVLLAYEAGYRVQLSPKLALSISGFWHDFSNLRSVEPVSPPAPFPVQGSSGLNGRSSGAELTAEWRVTPYWRLRGGYTEMRVNSEPQTRGLVRPTRDAVARDPNHQLRLRSTWDLPHDWECDLDLRYASSIVAQSLPGYTEANLRLGWAPTHNWDLSLVGQNLLHHEHGEFNTPGARRDIQRGFFGKATWRF